jgi:tetratricopeptide (TPR) repeat protein
VFYRRRQYREAIDAFNQVLRIDPRSSIAHRNLALCYRALGDKVTALTRLKEALSYARPSDRLIPTIEREIAELERQGVN